MLAGSASYLGVTSGLHMNRIDDIEKLLNHGNFLVDKVNFTIHCLQGKKGASVKETFLICLDQTSYVVSKAVVARQSNLIVETTAACNFTCKEMGEHLSDSYYFACSSSSFPKEIAPRTKNLIP